MPAIPAVVRIAGRCITESCISNWKITFSILLVLESLVFGHIILLIRAFSCISAGRLLAVMRYGSAIAGGIFLSTGLLHIIPESVHLYEEALKPGDGSTVSHAHAGHVHSQSHPQDVHAHEHGEHAHFPVVYTIILASFYFMLILEHVLIASCQRKSIDPDEVSFDPDRSESLDLDLEVFGRTSLNLANAIGLRDAARGSGANREQEAISGAGYQSRAFLACLIVTMGVAAHSILESVALGAARRMQDVLNLFIAIAAHRWATASALGIRYARAGLAAGPVVLLVFVFSFIAPIGVGFGFLAIETSNMSVQAILFAMAAGTFVYLGGSATLNTDEPDSTSQLKMYFSSAFGASIMLVITGILVATGSEHVH